MRRVDIYRIMIFHHSKDEYKLIIFLETQHLGGPSLEARCGYFGCTISEILFERK
jgi:hypothetical protein